MNINSEIVNNILQSKKACQIAVFKNFCMDLPTWQEFIDYLNESSKISKTIFVNGPNEYDKSLGAVISGNIMIKQKFYFYMAAHRHFNNQSKSLWRSISTALNVDGTISSVYINFSNNIDNVPEHWDERDGFYWQCIGSTEWFCNGNRYIVDPGDLVFIPAKSLHSVNFSMPRAAIGFSCTINKIESAAEKKK